MTQLLSNYPTKALVISHSSRSSFRRCARIFEFSKLYGDRDDRSEAFAGDVGNALHRGFQEYLISKDEKQAVLKFLMAYPTEIEYNDPRNSPRSLEASYATLQELIRSPIVDEYELVKIKTRFGDERPAIEVPFAIEIIGSPFPIPVYFVGFIDAILFSKIKKTYMVDDIKTTRLSLLDMSARYEFDEQTVPYGIILEQVLGHEIGEFDVSYLSAYIDLLEPRVRLYPFTKNTGHINDWYVGLCDDIGRMWRYYKNEFWPRATNGDTCLAFNRACYFLEYCSFRDPSVLSRMINGIIRDENKLFHDDQEPWIMTKLQYVEALK